MSQPADINNPISITVGPLLRFFGKKYYDLPATLEMYQRLYPAGRVDGFEFQVLEEWDARSPPRDGVASRQAAWQHCIKYTCEQLAAGLKACGCPILSIHANRDAGVYLCSDQPEEVSHGVQSLHESLWLADQVGAGVCVFHLWDTWKEAFDLPLLKKALREAAGAYPRVKAAVENVPTHRTGSTPLDLVGEFEWVTLDLRWAALYAELPKYERIKTRLANVHLSACLDGPKLSMDPAWFPTPDQASGFYEALQLIRDEWHYHGPLTLELSGRPADRWEDVLAALESLSPGA